MLVFVNTGGSIANMPSEPGFLISIAVKGIFNKEFMMETSLIKNEKFQYVIHQAKM